MLHSSCPRSMKPDRGKLRSTLFSSLIFNLETFTWIWMLKSPSQYSKYVKWKWKTVKGLSLCSVLSSFTKRNVRIDLTLHGKPWTFVLSYSRSFARLLHTCVKLESINTALSLGRIIFWTCHVYILPIRHSPRSQTTSSPARTVTQKLPISTY